MPRVGSSSNRTRGCVASHLPMTTFCWLPPDSVETICSTSLQRTESVRRRRRRAPPRAQNRAGRSARAAPTEGSAILSRIVEARSNPRALRSSVTSATPSRKGVGRRIDRPPARRRWRSAPPRQPRAAPKIDSRISVRPEPSSPPMPRISPRRRSKLTPCSMRRQPRGLDRVERQIAHRKHRRARASRLALAMASGRCRARPSPR